LDFVFRETAKEELAIARLVERALVMGGSIADLMAMHVLSDYFAQVTILERDQMDNGSVIHKSIAQGNHLHALPQGRQQVLSSLYPSCNELDSRDGIDGNRHVLFCEGGRGESIAVVTRCRILFRLSANAWRTTA